MKSPIGAADGKLIGPLLRQDFLSFATLSFGVIRPGITLKPNWHHELIARKLHDVARGDCRRLIITLPPRSLKSVFASVALPAFFLGHHPDERCIAVSYSDVLAEAHASDCRRVMRHPTFRAAFPNCQIDRDTAREVRTTLGGKRLATSIEGPLTRLGGNLVIIDDPIKAGDAYSEAVRARTVDWYRSTLLSRGDDKEKMRIVLVMQRVHENDLAGYLIEQGGFEVVNLPVIAERDEVHDLGNGRSHQRVRGELLHASHESVEVLRELSRAMGPIAFSAQYQQRPLPIGGAIIKSRWLASYDRMSPATNSFNRGISR